MKLQFIAYFFIIVALLVITEFSSEAAIQCYQCHGTSNPIDYRPLDTLTAPYRNPSSGGFHGNHRTHLDSSAPKSACAKCHPGSNAYFSSHRDGLIKVASHINNSGPTTPYSNTTSAFPQTATPVLGSCVNVNCHFEAATPTWGNNPALTGCTTCHGAPPNDRNHPYGTQKHATYYGTATTSCVKCHLDHTSETIPFAHATSAGKRGLVVTFAAAPNNGFGRYTGSNVSYPKYLPSQTPTRNGTCKSTYCHSPGTKAAGFTAPNQTATWGGTLGCAGCHAATPNSGSHAGHVSTTYGVPVACYKCHTATVTSASTISSTASHVNKKVDIAFNNTTTAIFGKYSGIPAPMQKNPGSGYGKCENVYCHSSGQGTGGSWPPTFSAPKWGNSASGKCPSCHDNGYHDSGNEISSGSHGKHMNYGFTGNDVNGCGICHYGAGFANRQEDCSQCHFGPANLTNLHINHKVDVSFVTVYGGTYSGTPEPGNGYGTCSNVYCHSNGTSVSTGSIPANTSPAWGSGTMACSGCHGNPPAYSNGSPKKNSHPAHSSHNCNKCHVNTTSDGTTIASTTNHVNKTYNINSGGGASFTYTYNAAGGTCTNISCHGNTSVQWGATACLGCHSVTQGNRAAITSQFSGNSHHIQGTLTDAKCYQCHWEANSDGSINLAYHGGSVAPGSAVDLVIYGAGSRPASYGITTAVQYTANGQREEITKINSHCLGCHSDANNATQPFGDGKTPKQYAWDGSSVAARYSQTGTTTWGKYTTTPNAAKKNLTKAYSAHGNTLNNLGGGWPDAPSGCFGVNITQTICTEFGGAWDGTCENISSGACTQNFCAGLTSGQCGTIGGTSTGTACTGNINANGCTGYCSHYVPETCYDPCSGAPYDCSYWVTNANITQSACQSAGDVWTALNGTWKTGGIYSEGVDLGLSPTRGGANAKKVACFDCHNSHGSTISGTTTSYTSATTNGGIFKDTTAGKGGYSITYKPAAGGSAGNKNVYNPGAGLCFDCHLTANAGTKPWGYSGTFGATQSVMGYWDSPYFGAGTFGAQSRYPYKASQGNMGGHFGASSTLSTSPSGTINGLCTPCHDPHGVTDNTAKIAAVDKQYAVPLLKGTWLTSPFKEDTTPSSATVSFGGGGPEGGNGYSSASYPVYNIDQNTFDNWNWGSATKISQNVNQFGGLCLNCHQKSSISPDTNSTWRSMDRIHNTVKGWGGVGGNAGNAKHSFSCSKCHTVHNARLPRLMVTNCLEYSHRGRVASGAPPGNSGFLSSGGSGGYGSGSGQFPGGGYGSGSGYEGGGGGSSGFRGVACHEATNTDGWPVNQSWNVVTPWTNGTPPAAPTLTNRTDINSSGGNAAATLQWNAVTSGDGDPADYYVEVDDASGFTSINYSSTWQPGTSWTASLPLGSWYWRVTARDRRHATKVSSPSASDSFSVVYAPPSAPILIDRTDVNSTNGSSANVTLQWNAITCTDNDVPQYYVEVDNASGFTSINYSSTWQAGTSWTQSLPLGTWYWRVTARDSVHTSAVSTPSASDSFAVTYITPPNSPTGLTPPNNYGSGSCSTTSAVTLGWTSGGGGDGHAQEYYVELDDVSGFTSINYSSTWQAGTSWTTPQLSAGTWYWRVTARDSVHTGAMSSATSSFTIVNQYDYCVCYNYPCGC